MSLIKLFAQYVIDTFLTNDKKGEFAALVIDEQFIKNASIELKMSMPELIKSLRNDIYHKKRYTTTDFHFILAIISLQLYAASKCETDEDYSANAYNPRLREILNCNENHLQKWYTNNQELIWSKFYKWCKDNNFHIQRCLPKDGKNKYVQYPLELAKYLLNREDLKYIASLFYKYRLEPNENIFYSDFWRILDLELDFRMLSKHIRKVFNAVYEDTSCYDIVKSQIYNYYLTWNGEYINSAEQQIQSTQLKKTYSLHLSNKNGNYRIDIRKDDDSKVASIKIDLNLIQAIKSYYSFKREDIIIFQRCTNGDSNYWDETRYIEDKESIGIAIVFNTYQNGKFIKSKKLFHINNIGIYEFSYNNLFSTFYSDGEKAYTLFGGLRVARNTYLTGGDPIWRIHKDCEYLIDGKTYSIKEGDHILNLKEGDHIIKFPKSRDIKITIITPRKRTIEWTDKYSKWEVDRKLCSWKPNKIDPGIIGLNFSHYSKTENHKKPLQTWVKLHHNQFIKSTNNIAMKLINNINKYE